MPKEPKKLDFEPLKEKPKPSKGLANAAWYSGAAAFDREAERVVPDSWKDYAKEWLAGYDRRMNY